VIKKTRYTVAQRWCSRSGLQPWYAVASTGSSTAALGIREKFDSAVSGSESSEWLRLVPAQQQQAAQHRKALADPKQRCWSIGPNGCKPQYHMRSSTPRSRD